MAAVGAAAGVAVDDVDESPPPPLQATRISPNIIIILYLKFRIYFLLTSIIQRMVEVWMGRAANVIHFS